MSDTPSKLTRHKKVAAILGVLLGLICHALPPEYQGPCRTVLHICTGGL